MTTTNYKETAVTGTKWRRACAVSVTNPYNDPAGMRVSFQEEDIVQLPDTSTISYPVGGLSKAFNPVESFPIRNPSTGAVTGSMTHAEFYAILYSLYMSLALERDGV